MVLFSKEYAEKVESFHDSILHENKDQDLSVIVVAHLVADKIPLCRALQKKRIQYCRIYTKRNQSTNRYYR
jgi:hypothetical protein